MTYEKKEDIVENLKDAGCSAGDIECFLQEFMSGRKKMSMNILESHRKDLLDELHVSQKKIDCLDYFIYKLERNEVNIAE